MQIVAHRINTIEQLQTTPSEYGIEFDVRESINGIIVTHDPWSPGIPLDVFLSHCHHAFYIVNVKCEGIEYEILRLLKDFCIENFFLLDCSFPMIVKLMRIGENRTAVRLSEYEHFINADWVKWIWIDVFTKLPLTRDECQSLRSRGFKLCLVSPELQGRPDDILQYKTEIGDCIDMVCTKRPMLWLNDVVPQ